MDFSNAIMKNCSNEVNRVEQDILSKLNDSNWVKANNTYNSLPQEFQSEQKELTFNYTFKDQGILVTAEIKKRFESLKWRVVADANNQRSVIKLYR